MAHTNDTKGDEGHLRSTLRIWIWFRKTESESETKGEEVAKGQSIPKGE